MVNSRTRRGHRHRALLILVTVPIARRIAVAEHDPRLYNLLMAGVVAHLFFTIVQIWVVDHIYHGLTDYNRYVNQGAVLAHRFDSFNFSTAGLNIKILGQGSVSIAAGVVFAIVGVNKLAGFFVFSWLVVHRHGLLLPGLHHDLPGRRSPALRPP